MNIRKFWIHLENQPPDSIGKLCLNISDKMAQENKSGLINKINLLCAQLDINKKSVNFKNPSAFLSKAENNLSVHLKKHQVNLISTNKKIKFYSIFKMKQSTLNSLIMLRILQNINVSPPNLRIESGRFTIPKKPEDLRICNHCSLNSQIQTTVQKVCTEFGNSLTYTFASKQT